MKKDFPEILKNKMNIKGITQADLARDTTIYRYLKNLAKPRPLILNRIAKVLDCSVKDF